MDENEVIKPKPVPTNKFNMEEVPSNDSDHSGKSMVQGQGNNITINNNYRDPNVEKMIEIQRREMEFSISASRDAIGWLKNTTKEVIDALIKMEEQKLKKTTKKKR